MSRKLLRVPMDFDWPGNKVWHGYLNPHYRTCPACESGYTVARRYLQTCVRLLMLAGDDSLRGRKHPYFDGGLFPTESPSREMAELTVGLAGREPSPFGHDGVDQWVTEKKIITAAGLDPEVWGICPTCNGEATDPEVKEAYESWQPFDPPTGEGYQLWETTSEGSPTSPVFPSLDDLCAWAEKNATTFAHHRTTAAEWKRMLTNDFVYHQEGNSVFM
jgi:hypothetical protein